jgi:heme A synthase
LAHTANGIIILALSILILAFSLRHSNPTVKRLSVLNIIFISVALLSGFVFLLYGQDNSFSMAMAMSSITAYAVYFLAYALLKKI